MIPDAEKEDLLTRMLALLVLVLAATLTLAACGGGGNNESKEEETTAVNEDVRAVCEGSPIESSPRLPASFPQIEADKLTYTKQSQQGPTTVVEGYFHGDVEEAHEEFHKELQAAAYTILFDEVEAPNDSEISWKGEGRTGQVAMRNECGESDKTYVRITNRPA